MIVTPYKLMSGNAPAPLAFVESNSLIHCYQEYFSDSKEISLCFLMFL
jgi:hypothetical protein